MICKAVSLADIADEVFFTQNMSFSLHEWTVEQAMLEVPSKTRPQLDSEAQAQQLRQVQRLAGMGLELVQPAQLRG